MSRVVAVLTLSLLLTTTVSSQRKTDLEREGLTGPVRTVSAESSEILYLEGQEHNARTKKLDALTFDPQARLIERTIYDDYGFLVGKEEYAHDVAGHLIRTELHDTRGRPQEKRVFSYRNDRLEETITYDEKGVANLREVYVYDQKGRRKEEVYYAQARTIGKTTFKIDEGGNLLEASFFGPHGAKAVAPIGPCFQVHRVAYSYDGHGRVIEEIAFELDGAVKRKSAYRYDDKGNLAEELRVDSYSTLKFVHGYEYDARGNWTKQTIRVHTSRVPLFGGTPDESQRTIVKIRKITYY
ncbi:MAG: hypothetical protein ACREBG_27845 [Pyrinomonadaceae bacterium]